MAAADDLIDFNVIESHKENIQALPSGRSAKALAQVYSPPLLGAQPSPITINDAHAVPRKAFEKELETIDEADDPLDVYDRYVKWTLDTYPSAQSTQSQLLPLLERATKAFQSSTHYKNDPRYLKLWLHYIRLFSDAPREIFVFLARHDIGVNLALYYEEFAAWLENAGRLSQAEEVYKLGLEKEARPVERLLRKFGEFERRNSAREQDPAEPTSPALPKVRPALVAKVDPFAAASPSSQPQPQQGGGLGATSKKTKGSKMAIFSDTEETPRPGSGGSWQGWDSIGSLADRKKENSVEARPWVGETLKTGKTNGGMQKMMVFKDQSSLNARHFPVQSGQSVHDDQCVFNPKTGRMEYVYVNLENIYPNSADSSLEYCFEELRAMNRCIMDKRWTYKACTMQWLGTESNEDVEIEKEDEEEQQQEETLDEPHSHQTESLIDTDEQEAAVASRPTKQRGFEIFEDALDQPALKKIAEAQDEKLIVETFSKTMALNDENDENAPPAAQKEVDLAKKMRREERANRTRKIQVMDVKHIKNETKTIQLNLDSPTGPKIKRKKSGDKGEPTMTINTREAMDEIYGIFSQPLPSQTEQTDEEDDEEDGSDDEDDYTTGDESTGTGKLSGPASEYGDETRNELLGASKSAAGDDEGRTEVSNWSDFTTSKHVPKDTDSSSAAESAQSTTTWDVYQGESEEPSREATSEEDLITPINEEEPHTRYVPLPPEGYEPPTGQYRDPVVVANNKLPFMTPIVERTESSLGAATTARTEKDYFSAAKKTPSRSKAGGAGVSSLLPEANLDSSPFQEVTADFAEDRRKVLQPVRTKSTKGTISLGRGTVKAQIAARDEPRPSSSGTEGPRKGPIITDEQCNPMDPALRETILSQISPPLSSFEGYHEHLDVNSGRTAEIKKYIRTVSKASKSSTNLEKTAQTLSLPPMLTFENADGPYTIKRELGAGTFAPVYLVENNAAIAAAVEEFRNDDGNDENPVSSSLRRSVGKSTHRRAFEAIKMEVPPSTWEFYMLRQSHRRLGVSRAAASIVRAHEMHLYRDECFLVEDYRDQGTLLDLINLARAEGAKGGGSSAGGAGGMDEVLAMFFAVEMLRTVEALHSKGLIHGDLKGDNVLVRFEDPGAETDWSPTFFPNGAHGWSAKGVCLIDFGRGVDMKCFVPHVGFIADWQTTEADCAEMRELRPWTFQIDYHGLAGVLHSLLFGKYMETVVEKSSSSSGPAGGEEPGLRSGRKTYRIRDPLKRYWQTAIWADAFDMLLNPLAHVAKEEGAKMPLLRGMRGVRERMEGWLEENCERGVGLKGMVSRMETAIRERRRRSGKPA